MCSSDLGAFDCLEALLPFEQQTAADHRDHALRYRTRAGFEQLKAGWSRSERAFGGAGIAGSLDLVAQAVAGAKQIAGFIRTA